MVASGKTTSVLPETEKIALLREVGRPGHGGLSTAQRRIPRPPRGSVSLVPRLCPCQGHKVCFLSVGLRCANGEPTGKRNRFIANVRENLSINEAHLK